MIDAIIFDFGDVFIDLHYGRLREAFAQLALTNPGDEFLQLNHRFEVGAISANDFLEGLQRFTNNASLEDVRRAWCSLLGEIPNHRLEFLEKLKGTYRLFLLSNTDIIHMEHFARTAGDAVSRRFFGCFDKVHFSYELGMRKPDPRVFQHVLASHGLSAAKTLFIDDKPENTAAAAALGIRVWTLRPGVDDVTQMFDKISF